MVSQKATIICLYEVLRKYSDEDHIMSVDMIRDKLKLMYDVDMERRAVYRNIEALRSMGIEIDGYTENREGYYLIERDFEMSEIRLLCDAVAASDMISEEQSKEIINKLIHTQSIFQGRMFNKMVYVKPDKDSKHGRNIFYNIDTLNVAVNQGCKVSVSVMEHDKTSVLSESETTYVISPYATVWAQGCYYIIGKREDTEELAHINIEKINDIRILEYGIDMIFGGFNPSKYAQRYICHKGEDIGHYELKCHNGLWEGIIDRYSDRATLQSRQDEEFYVRVKTFKSDIKCFVLNHLTECEVIRPQSLRDEIQLMVSDAYSMYCR